MLKAKNKSRLDKNDKIRKEMLKDPDYIRVSAYISKRTMQKLKDYIHQENSKRSYENRITISSWFRDSIDNLDLE